MARKDAPNDAGKLDPLLPQKKRARRRLIGAVALALLVAVLMPLLFDREPSRVGPDISVQIPSRDAPLPGASTDGGAPLRGAVKPAEGPRATEPAAAPRAPAADGPKEAEAQKPVEVPKPAEPAKAVESAKAVEATKPAEPPAKAPEKAPEKGAAKAEPKAAEKAAEKPAEKATGKASDKERRYLLQLGAFASEKGADEQMRRAKEAGLTAYTEKVATPQGERIRVRVGPFTGREAAEAARARLKLAGIEAALVAP